MSRDNRQNTISSIFKKCGNGTQITNWNCLEREMSRASEGKDCEEICTSTLDTCRKSCDPASVWWEPDSVENRYLQCLAQCSVYNMRYGDNGENGRYCYLNCPPDDCHRALYFQECKMSGPMCQQMCAELAPDIFADTIVEKCSQQCSPRSN